MNMGEAYSGGDRVGQELSEHEARSADVGFFGPEVGWLRPRPQRTGLTLAPRQHGKRFSPAVSACRPAAPKLIERTTGNRHLQHVRHSSFADAPRAAHRSGPGRRPVTASHIVRSLSLAVFAALFLTLAGGFGSSAMPPPARLGYWLLIMLTATLFAIGALVGVRAFDRLAPRSWSEALIVSLCTAVPTTLLVLGADATFLDDRRTPGSAAILFVIVLVVSVVMTWLNFHFESLKIARRELDAGPASDQVGAQGAEPARILSRLPQHMRHGTVHALQAEDHYLRVHCDSGSALILMRLADGIEEVAPIEGLQTHRSWWVARSAVRSIDRSGGKATLRLKGGIQVPVSRTRARDLREKGWFG